MLCFFFPCWGSAGSGSRDPKRWEPQFDDKGVESLPHPSKGKKKNPHPQPVLFPVPSLHSQDLAAGASSTQVEQERC